MLILDETRKWSLSTFFIRLPWALTQPNNMKDAWLPMFQMSQPCPLYICYNIAPMTSVQYYNVVPLDWKKNTASEMFQAAITFHPKLIVYMHKQSSKYSILKATWFKRWILSSKIQRRHLHTHAKWWPYSDMRLKHEDSVAPHLWSCALSQFRAWLHVS